MRQIEDHISKYLIIVAIINACLGTAGGLVFWALGMPNPALWGALAILLNFIPYLGALAELVGLVAVATFPHLTHALIGPAYDLEPGGDFCGCDVLGIPVGDPGNLPGCAGAGRRIFCDHIGPWASIGEFLAVRDC